MNWLKRYLTTQSTRAEFGVAAAQDPLFSEPVSTPTPLVNAAAQERAKAVSQARVDGVAELAPMNWRDILFQTELDLYLEGQAFWRIVERPDGLLRIDALAVNAVRAVNGVVGGVNDFGGGVYYRDSRTGREASVAFADLVFFNRYIKPARAIDRLQDAMLLERATLKRMTKDLATLPLYHLHLPHVATPKDEDDASAVRAVGKDVVITYRNEELNALNIPVNRQDALDLNEVRRLIAADSKVPPPLLASPDNQTYANLQALVRQFWTGEIVPEGMSIAGQVKQHGRIPDFALDYTRVPAMRYELSQQAEAYRRLRQGGMDEADARRLAGFDTDAEAN